MAALVLFVGREEDFTPGTLDATSQNLEIFLSGSVQNAETSQKKPSETWTRMSSSRWESPFPHLSRSTSRSQKRTHSPSGGGAGVCMRGSSEESEISNESNEGDAAGEAGDSWRFAST